MKQGPGISGNSGIDPGHERQAGKRPPDSENPHLTNAPHRSVIPIAVFVCHGTWVPLGRDGCFFFWAEDATCLTHRRGRLARKSIPRHPFQARPEELARLASAAAQAAAEMTCTVRLPTRAGGWPLPSPDVATDQPGDAPAPGLAPWNITGLALAPADAVAWLAGRPANPEQHYDHFGSDLQLWSQAARLLLELLARERFLPTIAPQDDEARWQLLLTDANDHSRVQTLADALPPVCRAVVPPRQDPDTCVPPGADTLVTGFLHTGADALIRRWLNGPSLAPQASKSKPVPAAQQWLAALAAPTPEMQARRAGIASLRPILQSWSAPLRQTQTPGAQSFRTCLRLEPPPEETAEAVAPWTLRILLQAGDDPSLLVDAAQVWRERGSTLRYLNRRFDRPQEQLLADLGLAARLFPPLERALHTAHPDVCEITTAEAYLFLKEGALLLRDSGLGVLLPANWESGPGLGVRARVKSSRKAHSAAAGDLGLHALLEVDWEVVLGDQPLSTQELQRLAKLKVPLVRVRGQWVEVDPQRLAAALARLQQQDGSLTVGSALRLAAGGGEIAPGLPLLHVEGEGAAGELLQRLSGDAPFAQIPPPAGLHGQLRPYQQRGYSWLAFLCGRGIGACLADDMGLGKTVQVIALLLHERETGQCQGPTLLICPTSLVGNWQRELARFAPSLKVLVHHGTDRLRGPEFAAAAAGHQVVISTYALAGRDVEDLAATAWAGLVLDEAQNIKNAGTRQSQSLRALPAGYRLALTGTPVENRLAELWSILDFCNPGYLGSAAEFHTRFGAPIERYRDQDAAARLRRVVQPFILRRVKTDPSIIQDLPEKQELPVYVNLTPEQATLYAAVVEDMLAQIAESEGIRRRGLVLAALAKLKQICNHPAQFLGDGSPLPDRSGKLSRLAEMLEEVLAEGDRALIFTQFAEMGTLLQRHLTETFGREVLFLHGGVSGAMRTKMVERFQDSPNGPPLFILSLKAGGVGLNLTRANHVFHFDRWWNPAVENQATDRAFRIGQQKHVLVHKFISAGTVEEKIAAIIAGKQQLAEQVVGTGEGWLTELSNDQLKALLTLDQE